jgi:hypothetical protein
LESIFNALAVRIPLFQFNNLAEEIDAQQSWLSALPGEANHGRLLRLNVLADVALQEVIRHGPRRRGVIEIFLFQVEAILTIQIADRSHGLCHDVKPGQAYRFSRRS